MAWKWRLFLPKTPKNKSGGNEDIFIFNFDKLIWIACLVFMENFFSSILCGETGGILYCLSCDPTWLRRSLLASDELIVKDYRWRGEIPKECIFTFPFKKHIYIYMRILGWVVATQIFVIFMPKLGEDEPILTDIFRWGWNHPLVYIIYIYIYSIWLVF